MKKKFPLVCLLALMMSACSTTDDRRAGKIVAKQTAEPWAPPIELPLPDDTLIARSAARALNIYVVASEDSEDISIDEEPIHRKRHNRNNIVFRLRTAGYMFPPTNAVTFVDPDPKKRPPPGEIVCTTTSAGLWRTLEVSCTNDGINGQRTPGKYKYSLQVVRADGTPLDVLDPFIVNH